MTNLGAAPETEREPVVDTYHGISVSDDYRWLEADNARVKAWTAAQSAHTQRVLETLPNREAIKARVREVLSAPLTSYREVRSVAGRWFVEIEQPPKQQPYLVLMAPGADLSTAKVILDPNALDVSGKTTLDWYEPSPDGRQVAVSLSKAGSENGEGCVIDIDTGEMHDTVPRVNGGTAGGDLAWAADGRGFYYTRYPAPGERAEADLGFYQQVYYHQLGADASDDRYELGEGLPRIAEIQLDVEPDTGRVLASVQKGDGGQFSHYLRAAKGGWHKLTDFDDGVVQVQFGPQGDLFAVSRRDAPRGVLYRVDGKRLAFDHATKLYAPQSEAIVTSFMSSSTLAFADQRFYVTLQQGGPSTLRAFDYAGRPQSLEMPFEVGAVRDLVTDGDGLLFRSTSFTHPSAWFRVTVASDVEPTPLADAAPIDLSAYEVIRETARSRDGTEVPISIIVRPGAARDGSRPCVATGYGGYGVNITPGYRSLNAIQLERGVTIAVANLRGGGEFGEVWHRAGSLLNKQNVFDDFAGVLQRLIERGYTSAARLGIMGGSNGGLLMGATWTQHPELTRAVVSFVGIYDMLRVELSPNGAFNVTEFGSVRARDQFDALYRYSPYHHVRDGVQYPSILLLTGENDPRVDPMQSCKMAARMQAASPNPVLLLTSAAAGHGVGADLEQEIADTSAALAFMFHALGVSDGG